MKKSGEVEAVPVTDGRHRVQHVTSGGGGAFTYPTHHLPSHIDLPVPYDDGASTLVLQSRKGTDESTAYPSAAESRKLIRRIVPFFLRQNAAFVVLPAAVAAITAFVVLRGPRTASTFVAATPHRLPATLVSTPISLGIILLAIVGWMAFAKPPPGGSKLAARFTGLVHGAIQVTIMAMAVVATPYIVTRLHRRAANTLHGHVANPEALASWLVGALDRVAILTVASIMGGSAGAIILAFYLVATNKWLKMHDNEAASAVASRNFKHFLRIRIEGDTATAWALRVTDPARTAAPFSAHDPRPRLLKASEWAATVELWDHFEVGNTIADFQ
jgi:hypothetical protein